MKRVSKINFSVFITLIGLVSMLTLFMKYRYFEEINNKKYTSTIELNMPQITSCNF
ncbi:hypothetical protein M0D21_16995 [Aquimarina sp. D1M17]|uniref:hypothetical protein n=1 Tax=Aquimarina acroporae TaxID=2937283 RepID=UPI0020BE0777|nr:hypothetical protein [Aquimarina acroporae]MCK8523280.1 hypothetical protein [Aquimarina acroporae]